MIRLLIVRHGESTWNAEHRFTGYEGLSLLVVFDKSQTA